MDKNSVNREIRQLICEVNQIAFTLFKIMIPILIAVKILQDFGIIKWLSLPLEPIMQLVGLPASMGFVWATAMFNSIFSAVVVYASLIGDTPLSVAQVTVLGTMILIAHSLPVEIEVARQSGPRFGFQLTVRVVSAFLLGFILNLIYSSGNWLQQPANFAIQLSGNEPGWSAWIVGQFKNLAIVYLTIFALIVLMRILKMLKILDLLRRLLHPILRLIGIGEEATSITVVALLLGISYGGGLIIQEAKSNRIAPKDIFFSLTFLGICHSLIEDTLLFFMIGGDLSGLLWARCLYAFFFLFFLVRIMAKVSDKFFANWFFCSAILKKE